MNPLKLVDGTTRNNSTPTLDGRYDHVDIGDVVSFRIHEESGCVDVQEFCDQYFWARMNSEQFGQLIELLQEMHKKIKP